MPPVCAYSMPPAGTDSRRVLHVDDEPDFAETTAASLAQFDEHIDTIAH